MPPRIDLLGLDPSIHSWGFDALTMGPRVKREDVR
jgi:hypothetical protein